MWEGIFGITSSQENKTNLASMGSIELEIPPITVTVIVIHYHHTELTLNSVELGDLVFDKSADSARRVFLKGKIVR